MQFPRLQEPLVLPEGTSLVDATYLPNGRNVWPEVNAPTSDGPLYGTVLSRDLDSTDPWSSFSQYPNDAIFSQISDRTISKDTPATIPDLKNAFWDHSRSWTPLNIYPSPDGSEIEQESRHFVPFAGSLGRSDSRLMSSGLYSSVVSCPSTTSTYFASNGTQTPPISVTDTSQHLAWSIEPIDAPTIEFEEPIGIASVISTSCGNSRKRRKVQEISTSTEKGHKGVSGRTKFGFPSADSISAPDVSYERPTKRLQENYNVAHEYFRKLCVESDFAFAPFESENFPTLEMYNSCVGLYFKHFHQHFPLLHRTTFFEEKIWILQLAVAAIGATFVSGNRTESFQEAFQEFLRRAFSLFTENYNEPELFVPIAQARLLHLVGLTQSAVEQSRSMISRYHVDLARSCLDLGLLQPLSLDMLTKASNALPDISERWCTWIKDESKRRLGYLIWLIDCALGYLSNSRPTCTMDDAQASLPCSEDLWAADSATAWEESLKTSEMKQPSLCSAIESLYLEKHVDDRLGELGHILLIHCLFQQTWTMGTYLKQPLSECASAAKTRHDPSTPSKENFWLPLYPVYEKWRNSACECLEILQWHASSVAAQASGLEHSVFLHLHLSRIVLFTPFQEIQDLQFSLIGRYGQNPAASFYVHDGSYQTQNSAKLPQINEIIWRWLREDQRKARLAMVHAGSIFWHVRRYSSNSFFEPTAVYLASIVLWAYGSYKSEALKNCTNPANRDTSSKQEATRIENLDESKIRHGRTAESYVNNSEQFTKLNPRQREGSFHETQLEQRSLISATFKSQIIIASNLEKQSASSCQSNVCSHLSPSSTGSDEESPEDYPQFIHLDRPCDTEMIQYFVGNGHNMTGHMSNIGDVCENPHDVLVEGAKLLRSRLWKWSISREYYDRLTELGALGRDV